MKRFLIVLMLFLLSLSLFACSTNTSNSSKKIDPNGDLIEETILYEELLYEDILTENQLFEYNLLIKNTIEQYLAEGILLEDIQVQMVLADDLDGLFDVGLTSEAILYDIDWGSVIGKFAIGTAVIVVTGTISAVTQQVPGVGYVFATSFSGALNGTITGAAIGGALNVIIQALSNGGKVDALAKYAIEGAADGFMWGAVSGALLGAFKGISIVRNAGAIWSGPNQLVGIMDDTGNLLSSSNQIIGKVGSSGWIVDNSGKVLGKLDDLGNFVSNWKNLSLIPSNNLILGTTGKIKYTLDSSLQVIDKTGKIVGKINEAGQIINSRGNLLGLIDDSGRLVDGIQKTINAGFKLNLSGQIVNSQKVINGVSHYLDDSGNIIGRLLNATDDVGNNITYIQQAVNPNAIKIIGPIPQNGLYKTVGQLDDFGNSVSTWNKYFTYNRGIGVKRAWADEKALIEATGRGTYNWTPDQIVELLTNGKVAGYQGHHINSALYNPTLISNPNNIKFYSVQEHLITAHGGSYQNATFGELIFRLIT